MPISPKQIFSCTNCDDEIESQSFTDCDSLEGSACQKCDFGIYQWQGPAELKQAIVPSCLDDIEDEPPVLSE
jgi:hypothetical protein